MDIGYSCILDDLIEPNTVSQADCQRLEIVCPECREPVTKILSKGVHFFSHASHKNACYSALSTIKEHQLLINKGFSRLFFHKLKKYLFAQFSDSQKRDFLRLLKTVKRKQVGAEWLLFKDSLPDHLVFVSQFFEMTIKGAPKKKRIANQVYHEISQSNGLWLFCGVLGLVYHYHSIANQLHKTDNLREHQLKLGSIHDLVNNNLDAKEYDPLLNNMHNGLLFILSRVDYRQLFMELNRQKPKPIRAGYIYVIHNPDHPSNRFKIGCTTRSVRERVKSLSGTAMLEDFKIMGEWYSLDCFSAERHIHNALNEYRIREDREFFQIDLNTIQTTIEDHIGA